jgi:Uma2 family endonuclease
LAQVKRDALTYEDYLLFPSDGKRYEIIEGERLVTPAPVPDHQRVSRNLVAILLHFVEETGAAELLYAPVDVVLSDTDIVQPDLLLVHKDRAHLVTDKDVSGAPDLVCEIVSPSTRKTDYLTKRKLYQKYGVREYWIADPEIGRIEVFTLTEGRLEKTGEHHAGDTLVSTAFPGLEVPVAQVFTIR